MKKMRQMSPRKRKKRFSQKITKTRQREETQKDKADENNDKIRLQDEDEGIVEHNQKKGDLNSIHSEAKIMEETHMKDEKECKIVRDSDEDRTTC